MKYSEDSQKPKVSIIVIALVLVALCCFVIMFLYTNNSASHTVPEDTLISITESLALVNFNDDYEEVIDALPEVVTKEAKALLKETTSIEHSKRNVYGSIKQTEKVFYDKHVIVDKETANVLVTYKELNLFNTVMTSYCSFKLRGSEIVEISTADYSNSFEFEFE